MPEFTIAEGAFIGAVAKTLITQTELLELKERLEQESEDAERANRAAFADRGLDDDSSFIEMLEAQESYMDAAVERAGLDPENRVVRAAYAQFKAARQQYAKYIASQN